MPIHLRAEPSDYAPAVLVPGDPRRATYIAETFFDPGAKLRQRGARHARLHRHVQGPADQRAVGRDGLRQRGDLLQRADPARRRSGSSGSAPPADLPTGCAWPTPSWRSAPRPTTRSSATSPTASRTRRRPRGRWSSAASPWLAPAAPPCTSARSCRAGCSTTRAPGVMQRWKERGHLAVEMEAAVLYTLGAIHKIETLGMVTISDLIAAEEGTSRADQRRGAEARRRPDDAGRLRGGHRRSQLMIRSGRGP